MINCVIYKWVNTTEDFDEPHTESSWDDDPSAWVAIVDGLEIEIHSNGHDWEWVEYENWEPHKGDDFLKTDLTLSDFGINLTRDDIYNKKVALL
jgi:hypothetical protein